MITTAYTKEQIVAAVAPKFNAAIQEAAKKIFGLFKTEKEFSDSVTSTLIFSIRTVCKRNGVKRSLEFWMNYEEAALRCDDSVRDSEIETICVERIDDIISMFNTHIKLQAELG